VILVDANLLIYAGVSSTPEHERARTWLDEQLNGSSPVGLPRHSLLAYLRITTKAKGFAHPQTITDAWSQIREWLNQPLAWIPEATPSHVEILEELLTGSGAAGDLISDAHLAALAIEHGLILCSNDGDFSRFRKLRWINPLAA
jgi:toxin-antitoxin system PIN domain toxin